MTGPIAVPDEARFDGSRAPSISFAPVTTPDDLRPFDRTRFHTKPLAGRGHLVETARFAKLVEPGATAADFVASLPDFLGATALRDLAQAIVTAKAAGHPIVWGMGGHVVKVGLAPVLLDLLDRGFVQGFVMNGSAALHDIEIALAGSTSEDVGGGLFEGTYGNADETGRLYAEAAAACVKQGIGLGAALGDAVLARRPRHAELSLLARARRAGVPVTVHVALGTDTVHMHPACDGATLGAASHGDFLRLASLVERMDGGVYVNIGSAVLLPEVFLKAVALVQNAKAGDGTRVRITTGNLDFIRQYRTRVNVVERPAEKGYELTGHHEILVPLLRLAILSSDRSGSMEPKAAAERTPAARQARTRVPSAKRPR